MTMAERLWLRDPIAALADGAERGIVVEDGRIVELVATGAEPVHPVHSVFDASRHVVTPGLVNTHHHMFQTMTRAHPLAINKSLWPWIASIYPVWTRHVNADEFPPRRAALHDRTDDVGLHLRVRPSLSLPRRPRRRDGHRGRGSRGARPAHDADARRARSDRRRGQPGDRARRRRPGRRRDPRRLRTRHRPLSRPLRRGDDPRRAGAECALRRDEAADARDGGAGRKA